MDSKLLIFVIAGLIMLSYSTYDAFAQPLQEVNADVIEFDGTFGIIEISWNNNGASYYEVGCVSCMPNLSDTTPENSMILNDVTAFANGDALLYVIAYDENSEIITATQVIMKLV
ncbi:hypothetical protein [Nitrosopumilus adriaticus]|uniref:Uncharacterized protein n=1 Tax=Nitrosopumilus adriaticus TaxID=1580092 RepID=A0A0D5C0K4_9ARCH|nr:hypothetical protein [Nitrosopumilus adriaticus]AJW70266.1 conserved exported protein of unknown function [Nitrosopumilus adriaticus]